MAQYVAFDKMGRTELEKRTKKKKKLMNLVVWFTSEQAIRELEEDVACVYVYLRIHSEVREGRREGQGGGTEVESKETRKQEKQSE